jgi:thymidylate synthase-like protein
MRVSLVWSSPRPERTIAVAMRRCYSTKPIEEIETELEQKGPEYWKYLLTKALQDKSLDVLEHYTMTFVFDGIEETEVANLLLSCPHLRATSLGGKQWLVSLNARTLVEMWNDAKVQGIAKLIVAGLDSNNVSPIFNGLAFGERSIAS